MICLNRHHAGIESLRETIDALNEHVEDLRSELQHRDGRMVDLALRVEELEDERKKLLDRLLLVAGLGQVYAPPRPEHIDEGSAIPMTNSARDWTREAEYLEHRAFAQELKRDAIEAGKEE